MNKRDNSQLTKKFQLNESQFQIIHKDIKVIKDMLKNNIDNQIN